MCEVLCTLIYVHIKYAISQSGDVLTVKLISPSNAQIEVIYNLSTLLRMFGLSQQQYKDDPALLRASEFWGNNAKADILIDNAFKCTTMHKSLLLL